MRTVVGASVWVIVDMMVVLFWLWVTIDRIVVVPFPATTAELLDQLLLASESVVKACKGTEEVLLLM